MSLTQDLEWSPSVETGLSGDLYLSEHIEDHVDGGPTEARRPGVYVLELSTPETGGLETYSRLWLQTHETTPRYLESIVDNNRLLYVGSAADVYGRIQQHLEQPNRSTTVASTFPIHHIEEVYWYDSKEIADDREHGHRMELSHQLVDAHVHSR